MVLGKYTKEIMQQQRELKKEFKELKWAITEMIKVMKDKEHELDPRVMIVIKRIVKNN